MSRLRISYVLSLVILGVLLSITAFRPMAAGKEYSEVLREQLLEQDDQWIIELHILNAEGRDTNYTIDVVADGSPSTEMVSIKSGSVFKYIVHIFKTNLTEGEVSLQVYKEGDSSPFEQINYHLE